MKKLFTLAFFVLGLTASAQQVNGDFDAEWRECYPWEKGDYSTSAKGTTPQGWTISNVPTVMLGMPSPIGSQVEEEEGFSVKLTNSSTFGNVIPAYITLGTSWATAYVDGISPQEGTADGGAFGGISFKFKPDGIRLNYKRDQSNGTERASVIAYIWNGTWTQAEVPSNTAMNKEPEKVTMTDRDRNILGMETTVGGDVTKTDDAELIASLESYITEQQDEWATFEAYFDYKNPDFKFTEVDIWGDPVEKDVKLNIIISANDYFADRSGIVGKNSLTIDNVELIYKSQLADLKYNGNTLEGFDKDTYTYAIDEEYKVGSIEAVKNCVGGSCEAKYNVATAILTITVKGDDWSKENPNQHIYQVQFKNTTADTYQIKNGDFEAWEEVSYDYGYGPTTGEEPLHWSSFLTGTGTLKMFAGANQVEHLTGTTRPGSEGNACVRIFARAVWIAIAQGNLTTGCINMGDMSADNASGNYNYSNSEDPDLCHWFTGLPDTMRVWVKASVSGTAKASALLHTDGYYQDPFYNDDNRITAQLVAEATTTDITTSEEWQELTIPFAYNEEVTERPSYALVSFSTSSVPGQGAETDEMYIDDLEFIYNSQLADLKINGKTIEGFDKDVYAYAVKEEYNEGSVEAIKDCVGGSCTTSYNEEDKTLTITVKGDDWTETNLNQHIYSVTFGGHGGTSIHSAEKAGTPNTFDVYTLSGVQVRHNATSLKGLQKGIYIVNGKKHVVR